MGAWAEGLGQSSPVIQPEATLQLFSKPGWAWHGASAATPTLRVGTAPDLAYKSW